MRTQAALVLAIVALTLGGCSTEPSTLEEVMADVSAKAAKIETYATDFVSVAKMVGSEMTYTCDMMCKGNFMASTMNMNMMGQSIVTKMILDASNTMWMDMDMMGMKQVMKMDMAQVEKFQEDALGELLPGGLGGLGGMGSMQNDPRFMLEQMANTFDLTYEGKERFNDSDVYVLHGTLRPDIKAQLEGTADGDNPFAIGMSMAGSMMGSMRLKIGTKDGFVRLNEMLDESGAPWMTMTYENVRINGQIDGSDFEYTPPSDAVVMDLSDMMEQMNMTELEGDLP